MPHPVPKTPAVPPATTRRIPTSLGQLAVRLVGRGEPLVLWHSMFVDSTSWDRVVPMLADHRRLVLVDAPSSGASDPLRTPSDIAGCAAAAAELLEALRPELGGAPVDWLGNAWGGHVGMHLAATRPELVRRLVAVSAPTRPIGPALRARIRLLLPLYRLLGAGAIAKPVAETLLTDSTRASDLAGVELVLGPLRRADRTAMVRAITTGILRRTDLTWAARRISCPVLFVTTDDRGEWTPDEARTVAAQMPDAHEATVTGSRVLPMVERPEAFVAAVEQFWRDRPVS
jgi:pimeloyl-ACP methyl ester carboxylesterase